jgi:Leucine-rich repeat (LRR) protein
MTNIINAPLFHAAALHYTVKDIPRERASNPMRCPSCGAKVKRSQSRCPSCGELLVPMKPSFGGAAVEVRPELGYKSSVPAVARKSLNRVKPAIIVVIALLAVAAVALIAILVNVMRMPVSGVLINEDVFPDASFRAAVRVNDTNDDGALSPEEIAQITTMNCSNRGIESLEGIANLTALTSLNASNNNLESVDLSSNVLLTTVNLSSNNLMSVNLSNLNSLEVLDISNNELTTLDVSSCAALKSLVCTNNQLARLDLTTNVQLQDLAIDPDQNVTIPISEGFFPDEGLRASLRSSDVDTDGDGALSQRERQSLTRLVISDPSTASLEGLAWLSSVTTLDLSGTQVTTLDGTQLPQSITTIKADNSQVSSVNLESLRLLISLSLENVPLDSLDTTNLTTLTSLDVTGASLTSLDITPCAASLTTLYVDDDDQVTGGVANTSSCFADPSLREALFSSSANNPNGDDLLSVGELANLTSLDLSKSSVTDLSGIELLTNLKSLNCSGLTLESVSCEGLSGLQSLFLSGCSLSSIDLTGADSLITLDVSNNSLTSLDVSKAPQLQMLIATNNPGLSVIDIRSCAQLTLDNVLHDDATTVIQSDEDAAAYEASQTASQ